MRQNPEHIKAASDWDVFQHTFLLIQLFYEYKCVYTGCYLTHDTNFDSLHKNPKTTLFSRITKCPKMIRCRDIESLNI